MGKINRERIKDCMDHYSNSDLINFTNKEQLAMLFCLVTQATNQAVDLEEKFSQLLNANSLIEDELFKIKTKIYL